MVLSPFHLILLMVGCALLSSLVTVVVIALAVKFRYGPRLERHIDRRLDEGADQLTQRFVAMLTGKSRDVIRERARDLARLVGGRRREDDDPR
ncbi:hypothetical protein [Alloalcanivorax mobilis]|uniref:hypothetical protein n=1 Tax=Alloalcanivorax mobilis TaxID=2019569 RepID=UPI000B5B2247|nr:hypothetical protein [Alloalcanivorax mobilis]ASK34216.1 hypothetical protein CEK62_07375 [Alcanivorax sp. N3-2A]|tara:strand:+ start:25851 stop:26129 length:279 start_codon:yes stop_codon:yes gene_type:complete